MPIGRHWDLLRLLVEARYTYCNILSVDRVVLALSLYNAKDSFGNSGDLVLLPGRL